MNDKFTHAGWSSIGKDLVLSLIAKYTKPLTTADTEQVCRNVQTILRKLNQK